MVIVPMQRWATVLGLLLTAAALGQTAAPQSPVNVKMRQRDGRLNTPVSLRADRIHLGELLDKLSAKTGVALSLEDTDSFPRVPITCNLDQVPLADVMNSLWSLVGSKNGLWEWTLNSKQDALTYEFRPTQAARSLPKQLNQEMQAAFEAQAQMGMRLAAMSPQERPANAGTFSPVTILDDPDLVFPGRGLPPDSDQTWLAMRLFANLLTSDQRTRVLHGEEIDVPIRSLSEQSRQDVHALERKTFVIRIEGPLEMPESIADTVTFVGTRSMNPWKVIGMHLFIYITYRKNGNGWGYLGMVVQGRGKRIYEDWILPGDQRAHDAEIHPIHAPTPFPADSLWQTAAPLTRNIAQTADTMGASFIAVLPEPFDGKIPSVSDKTPAQFFDDSRKAVPSMMHKWRGGILLVTYATWFYGDDAPQYVYRTLKSK